MIINFISNPWILSAFTTICVFFEMFFCKKWFTAFTKNTKSEKVRRGLNVILGIFTCFVLSAFQLFTFCDVLHVSFEWKWVAAAALASTLIYLILEKVYSDSELKELGEAFRDLVSHSDMFDGDLSKDGIVRVAERIFEITTRIDEEIASKEDKTIDAVVEKLDEFIRDGNITEKEKQEAAEFVKKYGYALTSTSTYEKYRQMLNQ